MLNIHVHVKCMRVALPMPYSAHIWALHKNTPLNAVMGRKWSVLTTVQTYKCISSRRVNSPVYVGIVIGTIAEYPARLEFHNYVMYA